MNIQRYILLNTSLAFIGLCTNITLIISLYGIYSAIRYMIDNKIKLKYLKTVYSVLVLFICLDITDLVRYSIEVI